MRRISLFLLLSMTTLLLASGVNATGFVIFEADADCEGWSAYSRLSIWEYTYIDVQYEVYLYQGGSPVSSYIGTQRVYTEFENPGGGFGTFDVSMPWGMELCGDYTAEGIIFYEVRDGSDQETFTISFTCECEEYCNYTPGFWKNHPEAWPVSSLEVGGITYSMSQLMDIFELSTKQDMTIKLAHHLIAAKLNVLSGSSDDIQGVIDDADAFLEMYHIGSNPKGDPRDYAEDLKDMLEAYNEMGCDDEEEFELDEGLLQPELNSTEGAAVENKSWGAIKDLYK